MREHEIKALMGYLDRIADALECIAGTEDHAPERMVSPQRLHAKTVMAKGIRDLPDLAGYYYPEPLHPEPERCDSVWSRDPYIPCIRDEGHPGPHQSAIQKVGEEYAWGNYKDEPDLGDCYCDGGGSIRHVHEDASCTGGHKAECFDPEEECVDVAAARRGPDKRVVTTHFFGDGCPQPHGTPRVCQIPGCGCAGMEHP